MLRSSPERRSACKVRLVRSPEGLPDRAMPSLTGAADSLRRTRSCRVRLHAAVPAAHVSGPRGRSDAAATSWPRRSVSCPSSRSTRPRPCCSQARTRSRSPRVRHLTPTGRCPTRAGRCPDRGGAARVHDRVLARPGIDAQWAGTPGTYWWQASTMRPDAASGCDPCRSPRRCAACRAHPHACRRRGGGGRGGRAGTTGRSRPARPRTSTCRRCRARPREGRCARGAPADRAPPRRLRTRCAFPTPFDATCRSAWRDQSFRYRGRMFVWSGAGGIGASFNGTRTLRAVAGRHAAARRRSAGCRDYCS